jgi:hypothetical protein
MRRAAIAVALLTALVLPGTAPAGWTGYSGTFEAGGKLTFGLSQGQGKRYVTKWRWRDFPVKCADGEQATSDRYVFRMRVQRKGFGGRGVLRAPSGTVIGGAKAQGEFGPGYESASGTFRVYGRTPEGHRQCESGKVPWTAARDGMPAR